MPDLTDEKLDEFAGVMISKGLAPWLAVTTKEQQAKALALAAATDSFNFAGGFADPNDGIKASARLVKKIAAKIGIDLDAEIDA